VNDAPIPAQAEARLTIRGVMTDLLEVSERLPVPAEQAERVARILQRLSEEIAEAAGMLRAAVNTPPEPPATS
jgi:hypothetical protein